MNKNGDLLAVYFENNKLQILRTFDLFKDDKVLIKEEQFEEKINYVAFSKSEES